VSALLSVPAIVQATPGPAADIGRYTPPAGLEGRSIPIADMDYQAQSTALAIGKNVCSWWKSRNSPDDADRRN